MINVTRKMYHRRFNMLNGLLIILSLSVAAYGQESTQYMDPFGNFSIGARNISLANSNVSESYDVSSIYENPATLAFMESASLFLNHSQGAQSNGTEESIAYPVFLPSSMMIAFGGELYQMGHLPQSAHQQLMELGLDVAFAGTITPTLSFGGTVSMRNGTANNWWVNGAPGNIKSQAWGAFYSFGLDYAPTGDVSYGLVFNGLGTDIFYIPWSNASPLILESAEMTRALTLGASMRYPSSESLRNPILVLSIASEKMFGTKGIFYKGGIEARPIEFLQIRFGYVMGPGVAEPRYGLGVVEHLISVEYAVYPQASIMFQQFSFSVDF